MHPFSENIFKRTCDTAKFLVKLSLWYDSEWWLDVEFVNQHTSLLLWVFIKFAASGQMWFFPWAKFEVVWANNELPCEMLYQLTISFIINAHKARGFSPMFEGEKVVFRSSYSLSKPCGIWNRQIFQPEVLWCSKAVVRLIWWITWVDIFLCKVG